MKGIDACCSLLVYEVRLCKSKRDLRDPKKSGAGMHDDKPPEDRMNRDK